MTYIWYDIGRLVRVVRGIRLLKLIRIFRLSRKMANVDVTRRLNPSIVRLIKLLGKIVFAGHLLGCMWFMVDECDVDGQQDLWRTCGGDSLGSKVQRALRALQIIHRFTQYDHRLSPVVAHKWRVT